MKIRRLILTYFLLTGICINAIGAAVLAFGIYQSLELGLPIPMLVNKILRKIEQVAPKYSWVLSNKLGIKYQVETSTLVPLTGINPERFSHDDLARDLITYGKNGEPLSSNPELRAVHPSYNRTILVATVRQLLNAIKTARAGDLIEMAPGDYLIKQHAITITTAGTPTAPIVLRGSARQVARIKLNSVDGIYVKAPFWRFENLSIEGVCANHSRCEHAFHVVGAGHSTVIRNSTIKNFNSAIKVNGLNTGRGRQFPDAGLVQNNAIFNTSVRQTDNPVTPIDIVGASGWVVRGNLIADFAKGGGDQTSYAAFMKANSADGLFERNLVICELNLIGHGVRLGLSFGGGGSGPDPICRDSDCSVEHRRGTIRSNIIMRCPRDVGIYLNSAQRTEIYNNTLHQTLGIDVRFPHSNATIVNNILTGRIFDRNQGTSERLRNLVSPMSPWFWQPGPERWFTNADKVDFNLRETQEILGKGIGVGEDTVDFCGQPRPQINTDLGAIEYSNKASCEPLSLFEQ
jgi:hypothetical protein